jgi:hypothetical protein
MFLLEDEGPYPLLANCRGIALLQNEGFLQAYLILDHTEELPNSSGYSPASFLDMKTEPGLTLAPVAELLELASGPNPSTLGE